MSVNKFRFVSPGVYVNEIDNSRIPNGAAEMGPAIIGRSQRGPMMRPVRVDSYADFAEVFGEPLPGTSGGDIWREGNKTAPTYAAYAAQAYLRNSGPVTFVRLGGFEHEQASQQGYAGWKFNDAYGLFITPISASTETNFVIEAGSKAALAAIVYTSKSSSNFGLTGKSLNSADVSKVKGQWVRASGNQLQFSLSIGSGTAGDKVVNFDKNSKKYIRSVLNTNPILTNEAIRGVGETEDYFLGETFKTFVDEVLGGVYTDTKFAAILVKLGNKNSSLNFGNFKEGAKNSESGWVVSQHKGNKEAFDVDSNGEYPVQKLFKVVGLSEGEWNNSNLKISIEDIKAPPNEYVKFGSFTLSVRSMDDSDLTPKYLERYTNLNLDPSSEDYIARRIGDKYSVWDYENKEFIEYGMYNNVSKFVRVEMDEEVNNSLTDKDLIPFGFYGQSVLTSSAISGDEVTSVSDGTVSFVSGTIAGDSDFSVKLVLPQVPMLSSSKKSQATTYSSVYFGLKTNIEKTRKHNEDVVDVVRVRPLGYDATAHSAVPSFLFTLDEISGSVTGSSLDKTKDVVWSVGSRKLGNSLTCKTSTEGEELGTKLLLSNFNRFTMPLFGGSDGVDITEKDPFNKRVLSVDGSDEVTNYAFNSVKVAIESISDAEVAEINLAAMPGIDNEQLTNLLIEKCEMRGDALAVIDLDGDYVPEEGKANASVKISDRKPNVEKAVTNLKNRSINSSYGCAFFPWVLVRDTKADNTVWVPPSVVALGTFSSSQRSTELWFAPAGFNRGGLSDGAAGIPVIQTALRLSSKNRDELYEANINPIATFPAEGIVIFGQKTLQVTPSALDRINVRRLMIYLKKEISRMARVVLFDPNIEVTWKRFTSQANPFLESVKSRFGLSDFRVVLDSNTTTPDLVDRNIVYAKILLKPTRAIEFIALDFVIAPTGASFND